MMRRIYLITVAFIFFLSQNTTAQSNFQLGVTGIFSRTTGKGLEFTANKEVAKNLSVGLGTRPIKFEEHSHLYVPVFGSVRYYYPLQKWKLFAGVYPGYGIYPSESFFDWSPDLRRKGTIYLSGGVGIMGASKLAPYFSVHFTKFGFTEYENNYSLYRAISTFDFTAGIALNKLTKSHPVKHPESVSHEKSSKPEKTQQDYLQKSIRQKKTAWILLGGGAVLMGTGIILATQQKEPIHKGLSLVLVGGTGFLTSLVSIPFFISSEHNKRKAMSFNPGVTFLQNPVSDNIYPAASLKMNF